MNKKATDIVSYLTIVGWLVAYFTGTRDQSRFHLNQGLIVGLLSLLVSVAASVLGIIPVIGRIVGVIAWVIELGVLALMIIGIINACNEKEEPLPVVGGIRLL